MEEYHVYLWILSPPQTTMMMQKLHFVDAADEKEQELASKRQKTEDAIKENIKVAQRKQKMYYGPEEAQCCILLQCWVSSPEEGLHSEEASRREAGLPVGRTICDLIITWKRYFLIEGA